MTMKLTSTAATILTSAVFALSACSSDSPAPSESSEATAGSVVVITTSLGSFEVELDEEAAPETVKNFLSYVEDEYYDGTIFHRVIKGFMIQGGGFDTSYQKKPTKAPVKNEADNGLKNDIGTLTMARTNVVDSATSQFFINAADNDFLNHRSTKAAEYGYAVFGKVVSGLDVVKAIESSTTRSRGPGFSNAPVEAVVIESIRKK
jgi:cyclophilin family peptidyl-prolyl cis-trans isomerase